MWFNLPVNGIAIVPNPSLLRYKYKVVKGTEAVPPAKINDSGNACVDRNQPLPRELLCVQGAIVPQG